MIGTGRQLLPLMLVYRKITLSAMCEEISLVSFKGLIEHWASEKKFSLFKPIVLLHKINGTALMISFGEK